MKPIALPDIDIDRCTGCGRCVAACPPHVLWLETDQANGFGKKRAVLHDEDGCTGCAKCYAACPFEVIEMVRPAEAMPLNALEVRVKSGTGERSTSYELRLDE